MNIDVTLSYLEQNKMAASTFAQMSAEEKEKMFKLNSNKTLYVNMDETNIFKDYKKFEIDNF